MKERLYLLPEPQCFEAVEGQFMIHYDTGIVIESSCTNDVFAYAKLLRDTIAQETGFSLTVNRGKRELTGISLCQNEQMGEETYCLEVSQQGILLSGGNSQALLYGVQTLRQIVSQRAAVIPCMKILDYPQMKVRGFYHDVTRGRVPTLQSLKVLADKLSYYKINQLQLYVEHTYLFKGMSEVWREQTPLTSEDILELDDYCRRLGIELVPSLSTFGHLYQLLSTKTYCELCELEDADKEIFTFSDRMLHHTINPSDEKSLAVIKGMVEEYMGLFSSRYFNLCADETFDLGKGRSRELAEQEGTDRIYINYVRELCQFVLDKGRIPMFWGDIICGFPEMISELPKETICLNWGYAPNQTEEDTRKLAEAGAVQYVCPGVSGWNQWINRLADAYQNIIRMCAYGRKYRAAGVLNTDWGDFGHVNHPELSISGMIYGAAFSWNQRHMEFDEINRRISRLEYKDTTESLIGIGAEMAEQSIYSWYHAVRYHDLAVKGRSDEEMKQFFVEKSLDGALNANRNLEELDRKMLSVLAAMDTSCKKRVLPYLLGAEGIYLFNLCGLAVREKCYGIPAEREIDTKQLASRLESWFMHYKSEWRRVSREGDLHLLQDIISWYGDLLRQADR